MTRTTGAALSAPPPRGPVWYPLPLGEDGSPIPARAPKCQDGDEILVRLDGPDGEVVLVTCDRRHGWRDADGRELSKRADAIAHTVATGRADKSESALRERYDTIKIRLPLGYKARLQRLADEDGYSVAEWISTWIEMAEHEQAEFRDRPPKRKRPALR